MTQQQRRHDRFFLCLPAVIERGKKQIGCETEDVSLSGLFLRVSDPPPLRELVKVQVDLQDGRSPIQLMGMAVRRVLSGSPEGKSAGVGLQFFGVGLQFFGVDPETLSRWAKFLGQVKKTSARPSGPIPIRPSLAVAKPRVPELRIQPKKLEELEVIYHRACLGPIQVRTEVYFETGRDVRLVLIHPDTQKTFSIDGRVLARVTEPHPGVSLQVIGLDQKKRAQLSDFVHEEIYVTIDLDFDEPELRAASNG